AEEISMNRAETDDARARLALAESELERIRTLFERNTVWRSDFERARAERDRASAEVALQEADLERPLNGARPEEILAAEAALASANARVEQLRDNLERHTLRAPFPGVIGEKSVEAGGWVRPGDPLFQFAEVLNLFIEVSAPEQHFNRVRIGSPARVWVDAAGREPIEAVVSKIIPIIDLSSRTFPARVRLDNSALTLAPGM